MLGPLKVTVSSAKTERLVKVALPFRVTVLLSPPSKVSAVSNVPVMLELTMLESTLMFSPPAPIIARDWMPVSIVIVSPPSVTV